MTEEPDEDRYVVVEWPECQYFICKMAAIYLASSHNAFTEFGDSAYFVSVEHYQHVTGHPPFRYDPVYLAVGFPESQLFIDSHGHEIFLINDEHGIKEYGNAAYFIEEGLYRMVLEAFKKEITALPPKSHLDFN